MPIANGTAMTSAITAARVVPQTSGQTYPANVVAGR